MRGYASEIKLGQVQVKSPSPPPPQSGRLKQLIQFRPSSNDKEFALSHVVVIHILTWISFLTFRLVDFSLVEYLKLYKLLHD